MIRLKRFKSLFKKGVTNTNIEYWTLPTTNVYIVEIALNKLIEEYNCDIRKIDLYHQYFSGLEPKFDKKLYIIRTSNPTNFTKWYFDTKQSKVKNFKFMGEVEVSTLDIEIFKLKKETNKYKV